MQTWYSFKLDDFEKDAGVHAYTANDARRMALDMCKQGRARYIVIEKNWKEWMIVWKNGACAYMKNGYATDGTYGINKNGSLAYPKPKKHKSRTNDFGLNWNLE